MHCVGAGLSATVCCWVLWLLVFVVVGTVAAMLDATEFVLRRLRRSMLLLVGALTTSKSRGGRMALFGPNGWYQCQVYPTTPAEDGAEMFRATELLASALGAQGIDDEGLTHSLPPLSPSTLSLLPRSNCDSHSSLGTRTGTRTCRKYEEAGNI